VKSGNNERHVVAEELFFLSFNEHPQQFAQEVFPLDGCTMKR